MDADKLAFLEHLGLVGVVVYLGSYAALQAGLVRGNGYLYAGLNLTAAILVLASLTSSFNLSSALIQISWIAISIFGMVRYFVLTRRLKFSGEEKALLDRHFPDLPQLAARRILDAGTWKRLPEGAFLARKGQKLGRLVYLYRGDAQVSVGGVRVAELSTGDLVGEVTVLRGGEATADVRLLSPARIFEITSEALEAVLRADTEARMVVEARLASDLGRKLDAANHRLTR